MSDLKISCPNCGGHVTYPKEIAGQAAACPHCQQPMVLGSKSRAMLWTALGVALTCAVLGIAALFWHLGKRTAASDPVNRPPRETTKVFDRKQNAPATEATASEDDKAIAALCRAWYERSNEKDFDSMRQMLAGPCKPVLSAAVLENSFKGGASFRFLGVDSIAYSDSAAGKLAKARIRRAVLSATSESEGVRELKCLKERDGWKLFRDFEWMQELVADFERSGFSDKLGANVRSFCTSAPFEKWPPNETNAFEKIYETVYDHPNEVFPWNLAVTVETNYTESWMLKIGFSVRNNATHLWENGGLDFDLKQGGKVVLTDFALLPNVPAGTDIRKEASFLLKNELRETTHYDLDLLYTLNRQKCRIASNIPLDFKVQKLTEAVKLEIVGRSFATTKNTAQEDMLVARVDYRVRNIGKEPLKTVQFKFVWFSLNGELVDQTTEYAVGFGDLPLAPQQTKSGFTHCGVGSSYRRVPVKVDIYLEDGEKHWPLYKGMQVQ